MPHISTACASFPQHATMNAVHLLQNGRTSNTLDEWQIVAQFLMCLQPNLQKYFLASLCKELFGSIWTVHPKCLGKSDMIEVHSH